MTTRRQTSNSTLTNIAIAALVWAGGMTLSCGKKTPPAGRGAGGAPAVTTPAGAPRPMPTADKLGIPECDEYIQKMTDCLAKMPLDAKSEALTGHQQSLWSWRAALSEGVPPSALVDACRASLAAVNTDSRCK